MPSLVLYATILFTIALAFYSVGVWAEHFKRQLKPWHLGAFFCGIIADTLGTIFISKYVGGFIVNAHSIIGAFALGLMIFHFLWAAWVLWKGKIYAITNFHRFSIFVWAIWMIAYLSGAVLGLGIKF